MTHKIKEHIMTRAEIEADLLDGDDVSDWSDDTDDDTNNQNKVVVKM